MPDTQWPRYVVLHQDREGSPHRYAGSVHAPDAEIAMLNARDVFVRRPECVSLWIVRTTHIYALTAEELEEKPAISLSPRDGDKSSSASSSIEPYYVFQKIGHKAL